MQSIELNTRIAAPAPRVFLLSLSVDLHVASAEGTGERAVAGVTRGVLRLGDEVTWRGRHFGLWMRQTARITEYDEGRSFTDVMTRGPFASFVHTHSFEELGGQTGMRDVLRFRAPFGGLGVVAERLLLVRHLRQFLERRNALLKRTAEGEDWKRYLPTG